MYYIQHTVTKAVLKVNEDGRPRRAFFATWNNAAEACRIATALKGEPYEIRWLPTPKKRKENSK